jgi:hypothetical protein
LASSDTPGNPFSVQALFPLLVNTSEYRMLPAPMSASPTRRLIDEDSHRPPPALPAFDPSSSPAAEPVEPSAEATGAIPAGLDSLP